MLARKLMLSLVSDFQQNKPLVLNPRFLHGIKSVLGDSSMDKVRKSFGLWGKVQRNLFSIIYGAQSNANIFLLIVLCLVFQLLYNQQYLKTVSHFIDFVHFFTHYSKIFLFQEIGLLTFLDVPSCLGIHYEGYNSAW